ncbi:predicted protein [Sclerotinia sclerotiorum 1980 UF-70]|uniref:Uncharacterized protein n=1 Tax=Sclerotinia sclerotiorum (strain ATCC 18683 / 1980 / Ss-1) TaxID=665079 RepID=A7EHM6_SCLS1|nr:predicted protein [Sclerotinia sclerotiorum 1980 UF-70]EDO02342.1 predicted protein [Sclerotinia sclerotiorum 1980 UF-70]
MTHKDSNPGKSALNGRQEPSEPEFNQNVQ